MGMINLHQDNCFKDNWTSYMGAYWACSGTTSGYMATVCMQTKPGQTCPSGERKTIRDGESATFGNNRYRVKMLTVADGSRWCDVDISEVPPVEDKPVEYIGAITQTVHEEIGEDEITFNIPVGNKSSKTTYNYIELYDAAGVKIDKEPDVWYKSISPGATEIITITSKWKFWSINDVQGQTVTFKLFSSFSRFNLIQAYMKHYAVPAYVEEPEPEPPVEEPTGKIWPVTHQIHKEIGKDEITFTIPVTNTSDKTTYNRIKLFDADGKYLSFSPEGLCKSIAPGATANIILTSKWKSWSIEDVQGQTVKFELFSMFAVTLVSVDTRTYSIEAYDEEPPYEEPPVDEEEPPYEEPPYEEPPVDEEEPPYEEEEDDGILVTILLIAIAYVMLSGK